MKKQETFDLIVSHLRQQGCRAEETSEAYRCRYRLPLEDGTVLKCAVGCLIPDELYSLEMEGNKCSAGRVKETLVELGHDLSLCEAMQEVHDNQHPSTWEVAFQDVAKLFDLAYTSPKGVNV